jgi:hypothetical protein
VPAMRSGMPTFSAAVSIGISPNDWKMNDTVLRRSKVRSLAGIADTSCPPTSTCPLVGVSSPPTMFSSARVEPAQHLALAVTADEQGRTCANRVAGYPAVGWASTDGL